MPHPTKWYLMKIPINRVPTANFVPKYIWKYIWNESNSYTNVTTWAFYMILILCGSYWYNVTLRNVQWHFYHRKVVTISRLCFLRLITCEIKFIRYFYIHITNHNRQSITQIILHLSMVKLDTFIVNQISTYASSWIRSHHSFDYLQQPLLLTGVNLNPNMNK